MCNLTLTCVSKSPSVSPDWLDNASLSPEELEEVAGGEVRSALPHSGPQARGRRWMHHLADQSTYWRYGTD